jgi:hypothetical protein
VSVGVEAEGIQPETALAAVARKPEPLCASHAVAAFPAQSLCVLAACLPACLSAACRGIMLARFQPQGRVRARRCCTSSLMAAHPTKGWAWYDACAVSQ